MRIVGPHVPVAERQANQPVPFFSSQPTSAEPSAWKATCQGRPPCELWVVTAGNGWASPRVRSVFTVRQSPAVCEPLMTWTRPSGSATTAERSRFG